MREMKDSGVEWIGKIPEIWNIQKVKFCFSVISGSGFADSLQGQENGDLPICKASDISNAGHNLYHAVNYLSAEQAVNNGFSIIPKDSILFPKIGEAMRKNRRTISRVPCCIDNNCQAIIPCDTVNPDFSYYTMLCIDMLWFDNNGTVPCINNVKFKNSFLPFPLFSEQYSIASFLDAKCAELEALTATIQEQIDTLEQYKRSVITEAVTKGLNPNVEMKDSGIKLVERVPVHWKASKFKYWASVKANLVEPTGYEEYPQISPEDIEKNSGKIISYNTVEESGIISGNHLFYTGQILYSKIRPNLNKVAIAPFSGLCSADMYPIETKAVTTFMLYLMLSGYFVEQVSIVIKDRVKMPKINQDELGEIRIIVPPVKEQKEIASYLDSKCAKVDEAIMQKREQLATIDEYKKSLIFEYVTGKKEVV